MLEVTNVSPHGYWLLLAEQERFLPFSEFPWFAEAAIAQLARVERPQPHHLFRPALDMDPHLDSIDRPDAFPLVSRSRSAQPEPSTAPPSGRAPPGSEPRGRALTVR